MGDTLHLQKEQIASICHILYDRGYLVATSGNVSVRIDNKILITPVATRKDYITAESIVVCDEHGTPPVEGPRPSSEIEMHKAAYAARPEIRAVIHAHPAYCVACSLIDISLTKIIIPELVVYTGPAPTVPYAMPGSSEQADAVKPYLVDHNAMLLKRHGVLVLGADLAEALSRLEQLEYAARVAYLVHAHDTVTPLSSREIEKIIRGAQRRGATLPSSAIRLSR